MSRNAFGRLLAAPADLHRDARVFVLLELAEALAAGRTPDPVAARWLGQALVDWLRGRTDGGLEAALDIAAHRGSRCTPQAIVATRERDRMLAALVSTLGVAGALDLLADPRGDLAAVARVVGPMSKSAVMRAVARHRA